MTVIDFADLAVANTDAAWRRTAHEFVHATLRAAILDGRLKSGSRLVQSEIADGLNVSGKDPLRGKRPAFPGRAAA